MDKVLEVLTSLNLTNLVATAAIFWYFTRDIKGEMKILEAKIDKQSDRTDRLYEMFVDLLKDRK